PGPTARDKLSCADCAETAPGSAAAGNMVGNTELTDAAPTALLMPTPRTHANTRLLDGWASSATRPSATEKPSWPACVQNSNQRRSKESASRPPSGASRSIGPSCAQNSTAT